MLLPLVYKDTDLAWIAGFMDGEGSFMIQKRNKHWKSPTPYKWYHRPCVSVSQVEIEPLEHIASIIGSGGINLNTNKKVHELRFHGKTLRNLLPQLVPYLFCKRTQAELVLKFLLRCKYRGKKLTKKEWDFREEIRLQICELNMKPEWRRKLRIVS